MRHLLNNIKYAWKMQGHDVIIALKIFNTLQPRARLRRLRISFCVSDCDILHQKYYPLENTISFFLLRFEKIVEMAKLSVFLGFSIIFGWTTGEIQHVRFYEASSTCNSLPIATIYESTNNVNSSTFASMSLQGM